MNANAVKKDSFRSVVTLIVILSGPCRLVQGDDGEGHIGELGSATSPKGVAEEPVSYDSGTGSWLFNYEKIVSRNDVVYTGPATTDWQAMPTGGGDLWTLVRGDGDLHLRLYKSDNWNGSLGNVHIDFGPQGKELASQRFHQRLDLYHGKVVIHLTHDPAGPHLEIWGHPTQRIIVIEVSDPESMLGPAHITLSELRNTVTVGQTKTTLWAKEIDPTPAGPSLVNTGMQNYFQAGNDPMLNRGTAVAVGMTSLVPIECSAENQTAT